MGYGFRFKLVSCLILLIVIGSLLFYFFLIRGTYQPLHHVQPDDMPLLTDDMDLDSLIESGQHQRSYLKRQDPDKTVLFGTTAYDNRWLLQSLEEFLEKLEQRPLPDELNRFLCDNYLFYQAGGRTDQRGRRMLVTGYYEPTFEGSLTRKAPFLTPLYSPPESLVAIKIKEGQQGKIGRYDHNQNFIEYWSRAEIETEGHLAGNELVFLKDPFDAFLLHVQGSGRIRLTDNSIRAVRYAGSNGLPYKSIGKLLVDEKKMVLEDVTIPAIRDYLRLNPNDQQRILHHNPRFIFFRWGDSQGPIGSYGEVLTPGRSVALDSTALPGGTIGYLSSRMPSPDSDDQVRGWQSFSRFVFPQDSGAAIKGTGRIDVFWGHDAYAELAANHMKEQGKLYFLVKKGYPGNEMHLQDSPGRKYEPEKTP